MSRIEISRNEFIRTFGYVPPSEALGVCFTNVERTEVVTEYVFTEDDGMKAEIEELERLHSL